MSLSLGTVLAFVSGLLAGVIASLRIIAPKTETNVDDKVLEYAEDAAKVLPKV